MNQVFTKIANRTIDETHLMANPFPGLRPFQIHESHLFFGREGQTDEVLMKLSDNRFVSIIGPSGSGKSSFVYCGVLPTLYGGFLAHKGADWVVVITRPGASPIENLAESLLETDEDFISADEELKKIRFNITKSLLKSSSLGLVEAILQTRDYRKKNYLILVDQFEELFRFRRVDETGNNINESMAFVNLLMEASNNVHASIYVATTMRSDFIGDCAEYPELTKKINDSHYLIPQMTRDQKRMAIMGPVAVGGGQISPRLVQQLLNDLGEKSDQLPILQHALMRTWAYWREHREGLEPIDIHHYEAIGSMTEALSRHANEAYEELSYEQRRICEIMFKALTEKRGEGDGIRRPTRLGEVAALAQAKTEEVITVVEKFRESGRSLLTPPSQVRLTEETYLDISHESLMRIWERLKIWAEEEGESGRMYLRLAEASEMFQLGKASLWRPPDLQLALNWQQKYNPTLDWAQRYHPAYERAMVFLDYSRKEWETEQKQKELQQKRALRRARITALVLGSAAVVSVGFMIFAFSQMIEAKRQTQRANEQTELAIANEKLANENADRANREKLAADSARVEAENQRREADTQRNIAVEQRILAVTNELRATENEKIANIQRDSAETARRSAEEQRRNAVIARQNAERLRRISIAKQMAIKSQQETDIELQGLLAQQAYIFNLDNKGYEYDYDIYNGLYYAVKSLSDGPVNELKGHTGEVNGLVATRTGSTLYSVGGEGLVLRWTRNGEVRPDTIIRNPYINRTVALNESEGTLAVGGASPNLQVFRTDRFGQAPQVFTVPDREVRFMVYNSFKDELVMVGSVGGIYSLKNGKVETVENRQVKVVSMDANPVSNDILVAYENGEMAFINLNNRQKNVFYTNSNNQQFAVAFSPDGKRIAVGEETGAIRIWETNDLSLPVFTFTGHTALIRDVEFSHDGKQLASGSSDRRVRLWNLERPNEQPMVLQDHPKFVWSVSFSGDDQYVFAGCIDGLLKKWPTRIDMFSEVVCGKVKRNMNKKEWAAFVSEDIDFTKTCPNIQ